MNTICISMSFQMPLYIYNQCDVIINLQTYCLKWYSAQFSLQEGLAAVRALYFKRLSFIKKKDTYY